MALPIISADQRLAEPRCAKIVLVGVPGAGKTSQLKTLPENSTLFVDLEAADLAVQDWRGDTLRPRSWPEFRDLVVFLAGPNPAASPEQSYSQAHFDAVCQRYGDPAQLAKYRSYFVDSITVLSRLCLAWAKTQPQSFSDRTGKPDTRGTYGLLGTEMISALTGERIRDKIAASKLKGIWMGGVPPLGYDVVVRKLVINETEAAVVRRMFVEYPRAGSTTLFVQQLRHEGVTSKSWIAQSGKDRVGKPIDKGALYKILNNPIYLDQIRHKGVAHPGEHEPIVTQAQWDTVQAALASKPHGMRKGLIYTADGRAMTPNATKGRGGRLYRYYLSTRDAKEGHDTSGVRMLPAGEIEEAVVAQLRGILRAPEMVAQVWREIAKRTDAAVQGMTEMQVAVALSQIDAVWEQLFPLEQHRIVTLLVERVIVLPDEMQVKLHANGIENLAMDVVRTASRKTTTNTEETLA